MSFRDFMDDGAPTFVTLKHTTQRAKKVHICDLCHRVIEIGQTYQLDAYTEDGRFRLVKSHVAPACIPAREAPDPYEVID